VPKPRSGLEIDLNECCRQLIAIKDFLLSFPREFLSFDATSQRRFEAGPPARCRVRRACFPHVYTQIRA